MKRSGSILIFLIWILILLSVLAVSVGFRSRVGVQLAKFYGRHQENDYQFHSIVNLAAYLLNEDEDPETDSTQEIWYGEPEGIAEFPFTQDKIIFIQDEEGKLNLNKVTPIILERFFGVLKDNQVRLNTDPEDLAGSIVAWRGGSSRRGRSTLGFEHKRAPFESIDELRLIQRITPHDYETIRSYFTVFARPGNFSLKININTVHSWILKAVIGSLPGNKLNKQLLFDQIELYRKGNPNDLESQPPMIFLAADLTASAMIQKLGLPSSPAVRRMINQIVRYLLVDSQFFHIRVETQEEDFGSPKVVEAVLGTRHSLLVKTSRGRYTLRRRLNNVLRDYPFEILYWSERPFK